MDLTRDFRIEADKVIEKVSQDVEDILNLNSAMRRDTPETGKYRGNLIKAASIPLILIEAMRNGSCCPSGTTYDLMSMDMEERRRALVHVQQCHKDAMAIEGTPFAMKRPQWR